MTFRSAQNDAIALAARLGGATIFDPALSARLAPYTLKA